jgi:hypothetical protein
MDQKNLMALSAGPVNPTTTEELPAPELAQLSEEALQLAQLSDEALLLCVGGVGLGDLDVELLLGYRGDGWVGGDLDVRIDSGLPRAIRIRQSVDLTIPEF